jgi:hypothetical protein
MAECLSAQSNGFGSREDDEPVTPKPVEAKPGPSSTYSEVYVGRSRVEQIPDAEFPAGLVDPTTQNWRQSIEASKPRVPENEVNALDNQEVERSLQRQVSFLRVVK